MIHLGLTGWPLSHSYSPQLHNAALRAAGLKGDYTLFPIDPSESTRLAELANKVRAGEVQGINITIPYKQVVMDLVDEVSPSAQMVGAINTIYLAKNKLIGHNTDAPGFLSDLGKVAPGIIELPGAAIVLGSGGSARAVVSVLAGNKIPVVVASRNLKQAEDLVNFFNKIFNRSVARFGLLEADFLKSALHDAKLIVNTTPVGMYPKGDFSPWPQGLAFPSRCFLYDLIYNPGCTLLVRQAKNNGLQAANGSGMLIEQAALAFEVWTGVKASREEMYSAVKQMIN